MHRIESKKVQLEVLSDRLTIPQGIYDGRVETRVDVLHGHEKRSRHRVWLVDTASKFSEKSVLKFVETGDVRVIDIPAGDTTE